MAKKSQQFPYRYARWEWKVVRLNVGRVGDWQIGEVEKVTEEAEG